ncbi:MAG: hypothetical protein WD000_10510, partial [Thermodesulfobacteriota bacterium]
MTLLGTGFRRILLLLVIAICIILIALNVILNIKLRADIPNIIEQFSKESPYQINIRKISLDPLFRLQLDKVSVIDPSSETKDVLKVNQVTVKPHIFSSLFSQRIVLGEVVLKTPVAQSNQENVNNLVDFIEQLRDEKKDDKSSLVEFGLIKILYADFLITPEFVLSIPNLNIEFGDEKFEDSQSITFDGNIGLLQKEVGLNGSIVIAPQKTSGELNLQVDKINIAAVSSLLGDSENLKAQTKMSFEVSDLITVNGNLTFDTHKGIFSEKPFAEFIYDLSYDKTADIANVNTLDFQVNDLLKGSFSGDIEKVIKETVINLSGEIDTLDLRDLMVRIFNDDKGLLSGELNTGNLKITGSRKEDDIHLSGNTHLKGFKFNPKDENDPGVNDLDCNLKVNQNLNSASSFSLSSTGKCTAQRFSWDKTGVVKNITARVNLDSKTKWTDNRISLSNINSKFMDGSASGTLNFFLSQGFGGGITKISGNILGSNLNLEMTPKTIIPANIAGNAESASARFEGGSSNYEADISLSISNFLLKSNLGREFRVSKLQTGESVDFRYKSLSN